MAQTSGSEQWLIDLFSPIGHFLVQSLATYSDSFAINPNANTAAVHRNMQSKESGVSQSVDHCRKWTVWHEHTHIYIYISY